MAIKESGFNKKTAQFFIECEQLIKDAYESGVMQADAEKHAARFLHGQIKAGAALREADLDFRMKKAGYKAIRSAVYIEEATKERPNGDKRPTVDMLEALVIKNPRVVEAQQALDEAEVWKESLVNYLNVFREGHIFYRGVAKGNFNG